MLKSMVVSMAAISLTFTSTVAAAAPVSASAAVAVQTPRPGDAQPSIDGGVPVPTEGAAFASPGMAGLVLPILGLAGFLALIVAIRGGNGNGEGSLSRG